MLTMPPAASNPKLAVIISSTSSASPNSTRSRPTALIGMNLEREEREQ